MESRSSRFSGQRIHFIGIGGCGMSGLARMLMDVGAIVSGSDAKLSLPVAELASHGATISALQDGSLLTDSIDLVVRTAAIPLTNAEYLKAKELGLNQIKYAELIGQVMRERLGIAVSGTHGKSTTTSMISYALLRCGADPSFVIGATVPQLGGSSRSGGGKAFVVEACEFDRSFHNYHPRVGLITNIEADHLDCYPGGIAEIIDSFREFAMKVPQDGLMLVNGQDDRVARAISGLETPIQTIGLDDVDSLTWCGKVIGMDGGRYRAQIFHNGIPIASLRLSVPGRHNVFNATAAVAACSVAGIAPADAAKALGNFIGVDRRMSELGKIKGATIVDDYGHHPTEIRTTLRALREKYTPGRLICVFQPHQHSRTRHLLEDFGTCFVDADKTILPDIYEARDTDDDRRSVSTADLVDRITRHGQQALHLPTFPQIVEHLRDEIRPGDLIVTMGAGNICEVGQELVGGGN